MNLQMMIDLETLGTGPKAVVSAIGALVFDLDSGEVKDTYYTILSYQDQLTKGREVTESTIKWWFSQSKEAQNIYTADQKTSTYFALSNLKDIISKHDMNTFKVWGNGPSFDLTILESLFQDFGVKIPWQFRNIRCLRTFKEYVFDGKSVVRVGIHHNALDDCYHQMNIVIEGMKRSK